MQYHDMDVDIILHVVVFDVGSVWNAASRLCYFVFRALRLAFGGLSIIIINIRSFIAFIFFLER